MLETVTVTPCDRSAVDEHKSAGGFSDLLLEVDLSPMVVVCAHDLIARRNLYYKM